MTKFDKKIIIIILLIIIAIVSSYFFTKDSTTETIITNDLFMKDQSYYTKISEIIIHIDGEVVSPGIVTLNDGSRISDAISAAGGLTENADLTNVNLAYVLHDGQKIHIPNISDEKNLQTVIQDAGNNVIVSDSIAQPRININKASQSELESLPGIGSSIAMKIIEYRESNGKFKSIEEIMNVNGIGESKYNIIKDYISI